MDLEERAGLTKQREFGLAAVRFTLEWAIQRLEMLLTALDAVRAGPGAGR